MGLFQHVLVAESTVKSDSRQRQTIYLLINRPSKSIFIEKGLNMITKIESAQRTEGTFSIKSGELSLLPDYVYLQHVKAGFGIGCRRSNENRDFWFGISLSTDLPSGNHTYKISDLKLKYVFVENFYFEEDSNQIVYNAIDGEVTLTYNQQLETAVGSYWFTVKNNSTEVNEPPFKISGKFDLKGNNDGSLP